MNYADLKFYSYNDKQGILLYESDADELGIEKKQSYSDCIKFYSFENIKEKNISAEKLTGKEQLTYIDSYNGYGGDTDIDETYIRNVENEQQIINCWVELINADTDNYEREMLVTTNQYYNWTSFRAEFIKKYSEEYNQLLIMIDNPDRYFGNEEEKEETEKELKELQEEMRKEWEEKEAQMFEELKHPDVARAEFKNVLEEIEEG